MKILLSAYACEPNKGSEPGVGWGWAIELAKHHEVWVITRENNQNVIEDYQKKYSEYNLDNLHFIYVGLSKKITFWKRGRRGMRLFYVMWQKKAVRIAMKAHSNISFDFVQHTTFVSYTQPTYMYKLGIPLIWGPISGGENIPKVINLNLSYKEKFIESIRRTSQLVALILPSIRKTMRISKTIIVTTEETKEMIPNKYRCKTIVESAIGLEKLPKIVRDTDNNGTIKIVMAGRLIYWKAFELGLKAYISILEKYPNTELHILGEGNKKKQLKKIANKYIDKQIFFDDPVPHDKIYEYYQSFDIFLNTSLRDSGCMAMMEAMSVGLKCIAIETGGPKVLITEVGGIGIHPNDASIKKIGEVISDCIENRKINNDDKKSLLLYETKYSRLSKMFQK